jgi:hypothetical protein
MQQCQQPSEGKVGSQREWRAGEHETIIATTLSVRIILKALRVAI